jgi:hypothetical protein
MINSTRIMFEFEWAKGITISLPGSNFFTVCLGILILAIAIRILVGKQNFKIPMFKQIIYILIIIGIGAWGTYEVVNIVDAQKILTE